LMPIRNCIRLSSGLPALRSWTCFWTSIAQVTASTALANSTSAVAHKFDRPARMGRDQGIEEVAPYGLQTRQRPGLVDTHEARVADHIG
jgi:hypothetical protein